MSCDLKSYCIGKTHVCNKSSLVSSINVDLATIFLLTFFFDKITVVVFISFLISFVEEIFLVSIETFGDCFTSDCLPLVSLVSVDICLFSSSFPIFLDFPSSYTMFFDW
jgi:hypothetical protein